MMEQLETELKLQLPAFPDYLKLIGCLGPMDGEEHQRNAFFDSESRQLAKAGWALRVRVESRRGLVTLKSTAIEAGLVLTRREIEEEISRSLADDILELRRELLTLSIAPVAFVKNILPKLQLARFIRFDNLRRRKKYLLGDKQYVLEIDNTRYDDGSADYELEVEMDGPENAAGVECHLRHLFATLDIQFEKQSMTKLARALQKAHFN